jgi:hypothetical protein
MPSKKQYPGESQSSFNQRKKMTGAKRAKANKAAKKTYKKRKI